MAIDFPNSPVLGQQHNPGTGTNYAWDGSAWNIIQVVDTAYIGDTPPANPTPGQQWFRTTNCQMYVWYNDGTSSQWVQSAGASLPANAPFWEPLGPNNGRFTMNAETQKIITDIGGYQKLRFSGSFITTAAAYIAIQLSLDNGATWKSAGTDYTYQRTASSASAATGLSGNNPSMPLTASNDAGANFRASFTGIFEGFNQAVYGTLQAQGGAWVSAASYLTNYFARPSFMGPCNAIRFFINTGTVTCDFTLEGVRG